MIKAIIFDCFGVVITDGLHAIMAERLPHGASASAEVMSWIERANKGVVTSQESTTQIARIFDLSEAEYRALVTTSEVKNTGLLDYIVGLRSAYKTALLSNIPAGSLTRRFTAEELERYFDTVVASGEIGFAKPEPQAYEITADRLGVRLDECIFIDDRQAYLDGAQAVGMQTILYRDFAQFRTELEALLANTQN